ncbi:DNA polymerase III subunit epsilon [Aureimonas ureilytica]|uniref:DNA polymerase III subunit epsilon n=1 Tax=Aureimonas ureilytica TaxID=401562 RepID=A0A175RUU1_9HYPH|nr:DNA polymerase III subunit epsilon [Aureimonas ureilytica]
MPTAKTTASAAPQPEVEAAMVECLEHTGRYRVLRKLAPREVKPHLHPPADRAPGSWPRLGVILDTETTGLDHAAHEVIELGMVAFTYDEAGVCDVVCVFSQLQQPAGPITPDITRITGITDEMVAGQRIDVEAVRRFVEPADLVIAHNARFDRPFCEKLCHGFEAKPWACSVSEVDWTALGFEGTKLGYLVGQCGYFHNGHRAVDDCHALLEVLAQPSRTGAEPAFRQLLSSAASARLRVHALGSPFHTKDILKARGYRWSDGTGRQPKCWWREIAEDAMDEEAHFLETEVYAGGMNAHVERLTACERFKA